MHWSHLRSKPKTFTPTFGGTISGGSFWSTLKNAAKRLFSNKTVRTALSTLGKKALEKAPSIVDMGLQKLAPQLQKLESKTPALSGLTSATTSLLKSGADKLQDIASRQIHKYTPPPEGKPLVAARDDSEPTTGTGRRPNFKMKGSMISASAFK